MPYQPRGRYFEEFEPGQEIVSQGRTITEGDIVNFAALTGDWTQIHTDVEYAKSSMVGERIAHGLLGLSIGTGLLVSLGFVEGTVLLFTGLEWKFKAPIKIGDTIHAVAKVKNKREMKAAGGGFIFMETRVLNQRDEVTQMGDMTFLVKSRGS
ncbi:MAG: MaoC/PaaZ C-terminal domain-containing protein [Rudaea sp.]